MLVLSFIVLLLWIVVDYCFAINNVSCGVPFTFNKILGGTQTEIDEFPWIVRLEYMNYYNISIGFVCGGVLLNEDVVLTAGHCIMNRKETLFSARFGEYDISTERDCVEAFGIVDCAPLPQNIQISHYIVHPEYFNGYSDIALLFLKQKVNFTGYNTTVKVKIELPIVKFEDCYNKYLQEGTVLNQQRHICAGGIPLRDTCIGDSGLPLVKQNKNGIWVVYGITSFGKGCALKDWPGIYTNVTFYLNWINDEMQRHRNNATI